MTHVRKHHVMKGASAQFVEHEFRTVSSHVIKTQRRPDRVAA
jgi:hypothetical protein